MKKLGKKFSYLTKVLLVFSLLFANLSSLSTVFVYALESDLSVVLEDDILTIKYNDLLESEDGYYVEVTENYNYSGNSLDTQVIKVVTSADKLTGEGVEIVSEILSQVAKYDGEYDAVIILSDINDEEIARYTYSTDYYVDSGMLYSVYATDGSEITAINGSYTIPDEESSVIIKSTVLGGGLNLDDVYLYNESEYSVIDLTNQEFETTVDLAGSLYGEYEVAAASIYDNNGEIASFVPTVKINYGEYSDNDEVLNNLFDGLDYLFDSEDGIMYVLPPIEDGDDTEYKNVWELYSTILPETGEGNISIDIITSDGILDNDTLASSVEEDLKAIKLENGLVLTLSSNGLEISYTCNLIGDFNNDGVINQTDLILLIDEVVNTEDSDGMTVEDALYFQQVIENKDWLNAEVSFEEDDNGEATMEVSSDKITSGDEFTVTYSVSSEYDINGLAGILNYDENKLELVGITRSEEVIGSYSYTTNKFLYLEESDNAVTFTFRALSQGTTEISINDRAYISGNVIKSASDTTLSIVVDASSDSTLSMLTINGIEIDLQDGVLSYEVNVSNDVTVLDVVADVSNVAGEVTLIDAPEELVVGKNVVTIQVTAENGDLTIYEIIVVRADEAKTSDNNTNPQVVNNTQTNSDTVVEDDTDKKDIAIMDEEDDDNETTDDGSSVSRVVIIILILLVIAGLVYLIFKDDKEEEEMQNRKTASNKKNIKSKK